MKPVTMPSSPSDSPAAQRLKKLKTLRLNKKSEDFSESTLMHGLAPETDLFYNLWQFIHTMKNLKTFGFTNRTDRAHSTDGWYLDDLEPVYTLEGNDVISTSGSIAWEGILLTSLSAIHTGTGDDIIHAKSEGNGILIDGSISTDSGRDQIIGDVSQNPESGAGIDNRGIILTGAQDDKITGIGGGYGIYNLHGGWINTGAGNDAITGSGKWGGLINSGTIYTSLGNDNIHSKGVILNTHVIDTHTGNDVVRATGTLLNDRVGESPDPLTDKAGHISLGDGNDQLYAQDGLRNEGLIDTGSGNDIIDISGSSGISNDPTLFNNSLAGRINTGIGNDQFTNNLRGAYKNDGIIELGPGADTMDVLSQGFIGSGTIDLGTGNDIWRGFSSGHNTSNPYRGGTGIDTLAFKPGTYSVVRQSGNQYLIGGSMSVIGFERFGSGAGFLTLSAAAASGAVTFQW